MKFEWVSGPPAEAVLRALENLVAAGMVGEDGRLTVIGEKVAECPVEVNIARMVRPVTTFKSFSIISLSRTAFPVQRAQMWRGDAHDCRDDHYTSMP